MNTFITPAELAAHKDEYTIIDVRGLAAYGEGHIYYRKTINMRPFNNPDEDPDTDDEKEEFLDDNFEPDVDDEDFEPDDI